MNWASGSVRFYQPKPDEAEAHEEAETLQYIHNNGSTPRSNRIVMKLKLGAIADSVRPPTAFGQLQVDS